MRKETAGLRAYNYRSFLIHGDIHTNGAVLDDEILADVDVRSAIDNQGTATKSYSVVNTDRSVPASPVRSTP
jgi:glutamate synthase (ferredoxin)